jgi:hypothetical protein
MSDAEWEKYLRNETSNGVNQKVDYGVTVENKIFTESFLHQGTAGITFKNCVFNEKMSLLACTPGSDIFIMNCVFKKEIFFGEIVSEQRIVFLDCSLEENAIFSDLQVSRLELNLRYAKHIIFGEKSRIGEIQIGGKDRNKYGKIYLPASVGTKRIEINHAEIDDLYMPNSTLECELAVVNSNLTTLTLDNFRNDGTLKFLNCKAGQAADASILINQSNLGKAEFFRFDFSNFSKVNFTNSVIYESIFVNCVWSRMNIASEVVHFSPALNTAEESEDRSLAQNKRDVYKQIKTAFAKQGDYVQEQFFHGLEMNQYYRSLSYKNDFWTKIILRLSYVTSDYGQSLARPVVSILAVNLLLFFVMFVLHSTGYDSVDFTKPGNYVNTVASLLNFMNPLHKTDNLSGGPFIVDSVSRVFSSYMIYNIIRSTRRFVK